MTQGEETHRLAVGQPRFSIRTLIVVVTIAAFVFAAIHIYQRTMDGLHEAYGKWGLAEMIIAFCEDHGRPPSSWDELSPYPPRAKHLITGWDVGTNPDISCQSNLPHNRQRHTPASKTPVNYCR